MPVQEMSKQSRSKRSTNVPQTFRHLRGMKPKRLILFPNLPHRKSTFLFGPGEQILDQIVTISSQQVKFGSDTKTFRFRFQNDIGTFVLSFLTLLRGVMRPTPKVPCTQSTLYLHSNTCSDTYPPPSFKRSQLTHTKPDTYSWGFFLGRLSFALIFAVQMEGFLFGNS